MTRIYNENIEGYSKGWLCPKCGSSTRTCRHIDAEIKCTKCNYILRQEGDKKPYNLKEHLEENICVVIGCSGIDRNCPNNPVCPILLKFNV